jgi:hypothetical protein
MGAIRGERRFYATPGKKVERFDIAENLLHALVAERKNLFAVSGI